jgi:hypothetical protein
LVVNSFIFYWLWHITEAKLIRCHIWNWEQWQHRYFALLSYYFFCQQRVNCYWQTVTLLRTRYLYCIWWIYNYSVSIKLLRLYMVLFSVHRQDFSWTIYLACQISFCLNYFKLWRTFNGICDKIRHNWWLLQALIMSRRLIFRILKYWL